MLAEAHTDTVAQIVATGEVDKDGVAVAQPDKVTECVGDTLVERVMEAEPELEVHAELVNEADDDGQLEAATEAVVPAERVDVLLIVYVCVEVPLRERVTVAQAVAVTVLDIVPAALVDGDIERKGVALGEPDADGHLLTVAETEGQGEEVTLAVLPADPEAPAREDVGLPLEEKQELPEKEVVGVPAAETVGAATLRDTLALTECEGVEDIVREPVGEELGVNELEGLTDTVADAEAQTDAVAVRFDDTVAVVVTVPFADAAEVAEELYVALEDAVAMAVEVPKLVTVLDADGEAEEVPALEELAVSVALAVADDEGEPPSVAEALCEAVLVSVGQPDPVGETVSVASRVPDREPDGLPLKLAVTEPQDEGDHVRVPVAHAETLAEMEAHADTEPVREPLGDGDGERLIVLQPVEEAVRDPEPLAEGHAEALWLPLLQAVTGREP